MSPLVFRWELIWRNRSLTVKQHLDPSLDTLYLRVSWNFVLCHSFPPLILFLPSEVIFQMDEHPLSYKRLFHLFHPYPLMSVLHLVEHQVLQNALPFKTRSNTWALPSESHTWCALEVHTTNSSFHRPSLPSIGELKKTSSIFFTCPRLLTISLWITFPLMKLPLWVFGDKVSLWSPHCCPGAHS